MRGTRNISSQHICPTPAPLLQFVIPESYAHLHSSTINSDDSVDAAVVIRPESNKSAGLVTD